MRRFPKGTAGADWSPLVRPLETVLGDATEAVSVIWP